ncbi:aspartate--tRNA ligase [Mycoplasma sp. Mirounga ES2805-ORL]|uniref:aspartate--tRNA ligase n=1 Tax=Mycoplasma sp. Mirounga ES2805-ORL TaxID=754514 RepID=UPI00197C16FC|nr:aspartate--tRNA ligase [Mycoplasma sp. Mirounga ES2805-ORL]QSF13789.1 aspartate--tRNA ligase [Mycoplasma sp. Mirounga ES2805-ORL]
MESRKIYNADLSLKDVNKKVTLHGWIANKRRFGNITFIDLRDKTGIVQCIYQGDLKINKESCVQIKGTVLKRKQENTQLKTGKIEVLINKIEVFNESKEELPFSIRDDIDTKEEIRFETRFLDLRRPKMQQNIIMKSKLMFALREFMNENDFLEIETPMLAKSTPEGARDFVVPTRNKNEFWALPQSPQLFKQLLMASGFERYYQLARCFRDEDSRKDRQPEFTQLDIEASFLKVEEFQKIIEKMFIHVFNKLKIKKLKAPFKRIKYFDSIRDYGNDKPDIRFDNKIVDIDNFCNETNFDIIKNAASKRLLFFENKISRADFKNLEEIALKNKANILFYFVYENNEIKLTNFANKVKEESLRLVKENNNKEGTYFIVANSYLNASTSLGAVRNEINYKFNKPNTDYEFLWITDWPMFELDEETNKWQAAHHPFTQFDHKIDELEKLPYEKIMAKSYDLVLNGFELGSGSARIYDKKTQEKMFDFIGLTKKQQEDKFGWFLKAFDYGLPPHCGIGLGLDRLAMIIAGEKSIRDVIAFPKNSKNQDLFTKAPSALTSEQLAEIHIKIDEK